MVVETADFREVAVRGVAVAAKWAEGEGPEDAVVKVETVEKASAM